MSDPRYTDPRLADPPLRSESRDTGDQRLAELESSNNAMWGWIAGGIVVALLLVFVFGRASNTGDTASNDAPTPPAATTGMAPPRAPVDQPSRSSTGSSSPSGVSTPSTPAPSTTPAPQR